MLPGSIRFQLLEQNCSSDMADFDIYRTQVLESVPAGATSEEELRYQRFELSVVEGPDQAQTESFGTETVQASCPLTIAAFTSA